MYKITVRDFTCETCGSHVEKYTEESDFTIHYFACQNCEALHEVSRQINIQLEKN